MSLYAEVFAVSVVVSSLHAVLVLLYAVVSLLCAVLFYLYDVSISLYVVIFSLCAVLIARYAVLNSSYAVLYSCGDFSHYTRCLFLYVRSLIHYTCASLRYTHGAPLSFDLKQGQRHKEAWDHHFEGLPKIGNPESGIRNLRSEILKPRMTSQQTKKRIPLERVIFRENLTLRILFSLQK